eukprot:701258-Pleurochrysis_carterae.AAC.1
MTSVVRVVRKTKGDREGGGGLEDHAVSERQRGEADEQESEGERGEADGEESESGENHEAVSEGLSDGQGDEAVSDGQCGSSANVPLEQASQHASRQASQTPGSADDGERRKRFTSQAAGESSRIWATSTGRDPPAPRPVPTAHISPQLCCWAHRGYWSSRK